MATPSSFLAAISELSRLQRTTCAVAYGRGNSPPCGRNRRVSCARNVGDKSYFEAIAAWLSANARGDITSATRQSLRLWSLAYDRASALLANRPIIWRPLPGLIKTVMQTTARAACPLSASAAVTAVTGYSSNSPLFFGRPICALRSQLGLSWS